jgi:hypothetical protein
MQSSKGQLELRLDPGHMENPAVGCPAGDVLQQCRFPDPGLTAQDQDHAVPAADSLQGVVQLMAFADATAQDRRAGCCHLANVVL